jgi:DNA-binding response OmpR family regulator
LNTYKADDSRFFYKRILLVDDDNDTNLTLRLVLEENGYEVDCYTNAASTLENFKSKLYDLVILDLILPDMDGFKLSREIKKMDKEAKICFLTASDKVDFGIHPDIFSKVDPKFFIRKPISNNELLTKINEIVITGGRK